MWVRIRRKSLLLLKREDRWKLRNVIGLERGLIDEKRMLNFCGRCCDVELRQRSRVGEEWKGWVKRCIRELRGREGSL
jgi:hypothetical protein